MKTMLVLLISLLLTAPVFAANQPCSGKKGGVSHCRGDKFVCHDGSTSGSKRSCNPEVYGKGKKK